MSPEQVEGKEVDGRSDIFSLGAVLYEALTGKRAFEGKSQLSVASAVLEKEPTPISTVRPLTPPALDHAIRKCLEKTPEERWQSASDLASELKWVTESGSQAGVPTPAVTLRKRRERLAWSVAAVACAIALMALATAYFRSLNTRPPLMISSLLPPTGTRFSLIGVHSGAPQISPDGRNLLLVAADTQGTTMLWLRPLDSSSARPVPGTEGADTPFWSADGLSVGFFANGKLKTVELSNGHILTLCDAPSNAGGAWNQQGLILFIPDFTSGGLYQIPALGGSPKPVLNLDKSRIQGYGWPNFLSDGRHFIYSAYGSEAAQGTYFASLDGRENKLMMHSTGNTGVSSGFLFYPQSAGSSTDLMAVAFAPATGMVTGKPKAIVQGIEYSPSSDQSVFAVSDRLLIFEPGLTGGTAESKFTWLDRSGKMVSEIAPGSDSFDLRLSPDGQRVAYSKGSPNSDIWIRDLKRDALMRLTFDPSVDKGAPVWSPDGNEVLFDIALGGKTPAGIYRKSSSGTGSEELLAQPKDAGAGLWPTDWSPNGQFILCVQGEIINRNNGEIWILPASADRKPRVLVRAPGAAYDGQFSPDGYWVAYVSKESGREEVYVVPFDGNQVLSIAPLEQVPIKKRWQVSANGGTFPRWRRDGKELFYVAPGDAFTRIGIEAKGNEFSLSEARPLFKESLTTASSPYDVSGDGQRFLINGFGERGTLPVTLVANWKELLKDK
jgi:Tol biopolymer transport system component